MNTLELLGDKRDNVMAVKGKETVSRRGDTQRG